MKNNDDRKSAVVKAPSVALQEQHDDLTRPSAELTQSVAKDVSTERARPLIFIGNDDGFRSGGLAALIEVASR